jgi:hypothetical protein
MRNKSEVNCRMVRVGGEGRGCGKSSPTGSRTRVDEMERVLETIHLTFQYPESVAWL